MVVGTPYEQEARPIEPHIETASGALLHPPRKLRGRPYRIEEIAARSRSVGFLDLAAAWPAFDHQYEASTAANGQSYPCGERRRRVSIVGNVVSYLAYLSATA